jgi:hypothetical protein
LVDAVERQIYGWLGRIPPEIQDASPSITAQWKALARKARDVAQMRLCTAKITQAKVIEREYYALIEAAKTEKANAREQG